MPQRTPRIPGEVPFEGFVPHRSAQGQQQPQHPAQRLGQPGDTFEPTARRELTGTASAFALPRTAPPSPGVGRREDQPGNVGAAGAPAGTGFAAGFSASSAAGGYLSHRGGLSGGGSFNSPPLASPSAPGAQKRIARKEPSAPYWVGDWGEDAVFDRNLRRSHSAFSAHAVAQTAAAGGRPPAAPSPLPNGVCEEMSPPAWSPSDDPATARLQSSELRSMLAEARREKGDLQRRVCELEQQQDQRATAFDEVFNRMQAAHDRAAAERAQLEAECARLRTMSARADSMGGVGGASGNATYRELEAERQATLLQAGLEQARDDLETARTDAGTAHKEVENERLAMRQAEETLQQYKQRSAKLEADLVTERSNAKFANETLESLMENRDKERSQTAHDAEAVRGAEECLGVAQRDLLLAREAQRESEEKLGVVENEAASLRGELSAAREKLSSLRTQHDAENDAEKAEAARRTAVLQETQNLQNRLVAMAKDALTPAQLSGRTVVKQLSRMQEVLLAAVNEREIARSLRHRGDRAERGERGAERGERSRPTGEAQGTRRSVRA